MELNGAKILYTIHTDIPLLGDFKISQTLVSTWIVMALLSGLAIWLGSNLKLENVSKRQAAAEFIVERLDQFVHAGMTEETYWTLLQQSFYEELTIANLQAILMTEYEEAGMTEEEAKAAYEAYKNGLIETHQDQITYYLDAS